MLGIARIAENGLLQSAAITAAIAFLGVMAFDISVMLGLLITPVTTMLSSAILAFVLLRHQEQAAMTTALVAAVAIGIAALVTQQYSVQLLVFTALCWLGALAVGSVLRQTVSLRWAVLTTVPVMLLVGFIGIAFKAGIVQFWQDALLKSVSNFNEVELARLGPEKLELLTRVMPELLSESAGSWAFFVVLCGVFIARYWQAQMFNPGGFQQEFHSLQLGKEVVVAFAIAIALSLIIPVSLFAMIASALMFVFFIQGLSVLHCITKQRGLSRSWLTGMYVILWLPPTTFFLSILGMADNLFRLRKI